MFYSKLTYLFNVSGSNKHKRDPDIDKAPKINGGIAKNILAVYKIYELKKVKAYPATCAAATPCARTIVGMSSAAYCALELYATVTPNRPIIARDANKIGSGK